MLNCNCMLWELYLVTAILLGSTVRLSLEFLFSLDGPCLEVDGSDYKSSVTIRNCSADSLGLEFVLQPGKSDFNFRIELACNDLQTPRVMQSNDDQTVKLSDGALNFPINPPINDSVMECIITVCYLDSQWYDPYLITHRPTFQPQQDCLASGPDVIMSHSTVIDYSSSNIAIMIEQQEFFSSVNSVGEMLPDIVATSTSHRPHPSYIHTPTPILLAPTSVPSSSSSSSSTTTKPLQEISYSSNSHSHFSSSSTKRNSINHTLQKQTSLLTATTIITTPPFLFHPTSSYIVITASSVLVTRQISTGATDTGQLIGLIVIAILVSITCIVAIAAIIFCVFRIGSTSDHEKQQDNLDNNPTVNVEDIKAYMEPYCSALSPSLRTITESPIPSTIAQDIEDESTTNSNHHCMFSFNQSRTETMPIEGYSDISLTIDISDTSTSTIGVESFCDHRNQTQTHDSTASDNIDTSDAVGSLSSTSLNIIIDLSQEECSEHHRASVDTKDLEDGDSPYIHAVDAFNL